MYAIRSKMTAYTEFSRKMREKSISLRENAIDENT